MKSNKKYVNVGLLLGSLSSLVASVIAAIRISESGFPWEVILTAIGATFMALMTDKDGDGKPALFDRDDGPDPEDKKEG